MTEDTFPRLLLRNRRQWGDGRVAMRKKEYGLWRQYSWEYCYSTVKAYSLGLLSLGLEPGDRVLVLGDNTPEWYWSELAVQCAGGVAVGTSPGASPQEMEYLLGDSQSRFALAQDQEQVDKLLEIKDRLPALGKIVYWDGRGLRHYNDDALVSLAEVMRLGEEHEKGHPGDFDQRQGLGSSDEVATIVYIAAGAGAPRALRLTHRFLLSSLQALQSLAPVCPEDDYVSMITPSWFFEQVFGFGRWLTAGQTVNFAERLETVSADMREVSPQILVYPAGVWEGIASAIQTNVGSGVWLKRSLFRRCMSVGYERAGLLRTGGRTTALRRLLFRAADMAVFRPLRDKHGLDRLKTAHAAGSKLTPDTANFFSAIGVDLVQVFASTEEGIVTSEPEDGLRVE
jgi:long-chain acyl-CoA synthetase